MVASFNRMEPTNPSKLYVNPKVNDAFQKSFWLEYFNRNQGFDDGISLEFSHNFQNLEEQEYMTIVKGLQIQINEPMLVIVTRLPMGFPWEKEERKLALYAKRIFLGSYETMEENKNGFKRENFPSPRDEVVLHIMKYITCDGRNSMVYSFHFKLLHQRRHFLSTYLKRT